MQTINQLPKKQIQEGARKLSQGYIKQGFKPEALHEYTNEQGEPSYWRIRLSNPATGEKKIFPMRFNAGQFELKEPEFSGKKPLYKLHTLIDSDLIYFVEGEKCADSLIKLGLCATTSGGSTSHDKADFSPLRGDMVLIWPDNDPAGYKHAEEVQAILLLKGGTPKMIDVKALGLPEKGDAVDWLALHPLATKQDIERLPCVHEAVIEHSDPAPTIPDATNETQDQVIERLSKLSAIEYDKVRKNEAKKLGIDRVSILDSAVKEKQSFEQSKQSHFFNDDDPWPELVHGEALLSDIANVVHQYIICQPEVGHATALWVVMTYLMDAIHVAPLAIITAPEKACGKSKLLELLGKLCFHPLPTSNISAPALFRSIEAWQPTLLIDETDTFLGENEDLRGIINSGHTRSNAFVMRVEGDNFDPVRFSTWAAKALSGIGNKNLHDTITSRAIILELRRKLPSETIERLRAKDDAVFKPIRQKILRWASDHRFDIEHASPVLPETLSDREQDNWEGLLAIADLAGGKWPELARLTAVKLSNKQDTKSFKTELLEDIRAVFEHKATDRISSAELILGLCADEEAAWKTYNRGREISPKQLSGLLRGYGIISKTVRIGMGTPKGFELQQFTEIWERYTNTIPSGLTPEISRHTPQANEHIGKSVAGVPQHKTPSATEKPIFYKACGGVADKTPPSPTKEGFSGDHFAGEAF